MSNQEPPFPGISPRAAALTLLLFERVVRRYEREKGYALSEADKRAIQSVLRSIAARDSRP